MGGDYQDVVGQRFGMLTVVRITDSDLRGNARALCRCECGATKVTRLSRLRADGVSSCGCLRGKSNRSRALPLAERFASKVERNGPVIRPELGPCHLWTGTLSRLGYGRIHVAGFPSMVEAHRVAYFLDHGEWPKSDVMHRCDNPPCVRGDHLVDGTHAENMRDCAEKGRRPSGEGHPHAKLTESIVREIRASLEPRAVVAARFGISKDNVSDVRLRRTWKHVT